MLGLNERRTFLLAMTMTELVILLFFVVLLLAYQERSHSASEEARAMEAEASLSEIRNQIASALEDRGFDSIADPSDEDFVRLVREVLPDPRVHESLVEQRARLEEEVESLTSENSDLSEKLRVSEESRENIRDQLGFVSKQCGPEGHGPPPCWIGDDKKIEYIYTVVLMEDELEVERAWPSHREDDVGRIQGARELVGKTFTAAEFQQRASPVKMWADSQNPKCVHFVRVRDRAVTKDAYKRQLGIVENYFYKYLE